MLLFILEDPAGSDRGPGEKIPHTIVLSALRLEYSIMKISKKTLLLEVFSETILLGKGC